MCDEIEKWLFVQRRTFSHQNSVLTERCMQVPFQGPPTDAMETLGDGGLGFGLSLHRDVDIKANNFPHAYSTPTEYDVWFVATYHLSMSGFSRSTRPVEWT
jgi:hypothetical protein